MGRAKAVHLLPPAMLAAIHLALLLAFAIGLSSCGGHPAGAPATPAASAARGAAPASDGAAYPDEQLPVEAGVHISPPRRGAWGTDPPASGQHYSYPGLAPAPWGYTERGLQPEVWIHNLEHGGIAVLYACSSGCAADLAAIRGFIQGAPRESRFGEVKILDAPYAVPGHRFALMAWGRRQYMDAWDSGRALSFYESHVDRGPELVP